MDNTIFQMKPDSNVIKDMLIHMAKLTIEKIGPSRGNFVFWHPKGKDSNRLENAVQRHSGEIVLRNQSK